MWRYRLIDYNMVIYYMCERFGFKNGVQFCITDGEFKTDCEATWDRVFNSDTLPDRILSNRFIGKNPRLKTRIYLGVKRNDKRLLSYYYDNYNTIKADAVTTMTIKDPLKLLDNLPMTLGNRTMSYDVETCDILIADTDTGLLLGIIDCSSGVIQLSDSVNNQDLVFLLQSSEMFLTVYNRKDTSCHRRPKIRKIK